MKKVGKFPSKIENNMLGQPSEDQVKEAIRVLKKGGIVIFPTDTVYGIGCCFDRPKAVDRIYKIKNTPRGQPFPVLVSKADQLRQYVQVTMQAENLIKKYWPGALTIVLQSKGGKNKIGFRMPDSSLIKLLIDGVGVPIIGTSANFHGSMPPKSYEELDAGFTKFADFILKGKCKLGVESTVVDATIDHPEVLREGAIKLQ